MALYLGGRGYDVAVHYASSDDGAQDTVNQIKAMGRNAIALQADLLDEDAAQALVQRAVDGLGALTQTTAQGLAPHVRVNGIGPGPTLQGHRQSAGHFAQQRAATVLERGANPKDITAALGYFLDAGAVTGQMISVDGGQHLAWQTPDVLGVE